MAVRRRHRRVRAGACLGPAWARAHRPFTTAKRAAVSLVLAAAVGLLWCLFAAGRRRRALCLAMAVLCAADIALNAFLVVRAIDSGKEYRVYSYGGVYLLCR